MIRSFVAVDIPDSVKNELEKIGELLRREIPGARMRWSRPSGVHLTLKFLGDVSESDLPNIKTALAQVGARHNPFSLVVGGLGCFPNARQPRVVWVGVQEEGGVLAALQRDVEKSLAPLGFKPEKRAFHPHLTLGRARRDIRHSDQRLLGELTASMPAEGLAQVRVESFRLMRSDLQPDGAVYTSLQLFALGAGREAA
jgi:2'-5' RNA ligase